MARPPTPVQGDPLNLNAWHLQVAEAVAALPDGAAVADVQALLGPDVPAGAVEDALSGLQAAGLVSVEGSTVRHAEGLDAGIPSPFGLPPRAADVLAESTVAELQRVGQAVGVHPTGRKAQVQAAVHAALVDPVRIRKAAARPPAGLADALHAEIAEATEQDDEVRYDLAAFTMQRRLSDWLVAQGLAVRHQWRETVVPREVVLVLRGPDWHPESTPTAPQLPTAPVDPEQVDRQAAANAVAATELVDELLAACAGAPPALLAAGGIGVREVRRLARLVGREEHEAALALEVAGAADLLAPLDGTARPTSGWDAWRVRPAVDRWCALVEAWWDMPYAPAAPRPDGKPLSPLSVRVPRGIPRDDVRECLLTRLVALPRAAGILDIAALVERMLWEAPLAFGPEAGMEAAAAWVEACWLGLAAAGSLSPAGRALATEGVAGLRGSAGAAFPAPSSRATFQADLTAVVAGTPESALRDLLGSAADVESRGAATVWRFSAGSVRRAYDEGSTTDELLTALRDAAAGRELPQTLTYLVQDVGRQHGRVRVSAAHACLVVDDAALATELQASRALRPLGLRRVALTVLLSPQAPEAVLAGLRDAGYAPAQEEEAAEVVRVRSVRAPSARPPAPTGGGRSAAGADDGLAAVLPGLVPVEVRVLAEALERGGAVRIDYLDRSGRRTRRTVSDLSLEPPFLVGWCHLREDERQFALARIEGVQRVRG